MGKKRIINQDQEELLKEKEIIDQLSQKEKEVKVTRPAIEGRVYIASSYNNTSVTLTDKKGNVLSWATAGNLGFKGSKKSTPFAASRVAEVLADNAKKIGMEKIEVFVKGVGGGRDSALRSLVAKGFEITSVRDITPIPHNGCRPPKVRRI